MSVHKNTRNTTDKFIYSYLHITNNLYFYLLLQVTSFIFDFPLETKGRGGSRLKWVNLLTILEIVGHGDKNPFQWKYLHLKPENLKNKGWSKTTLEETNVSLGSNRHCEICLSMYRKQPL